MIAVLVGVLVLLAVAVGSAQLLRTKGNRPRHGDGGLPVDRVGGGTSPRRLGGPVYLRGDLADDLVGIETRQLPLAQTGLPVHDRDAMARHPGTLRRALAALERL